MHHHRLGMQLSRFRWQDRRRKDKYTSTRLFHTLTLASFTCEIMEVFESTRQGLDRAYFSCDLAVRSAKFFFPFSFRFCVGERGEMAYDQDSTLYSTPYVLSGLRAGPFIYCQDYSIQYFLLLFCACCHFLPHLPKEVHRVPTNSGNFFSCYIFESGQTAVAAARETS
ncbi:hypothetical protein BCV70DRAFT_43373 [Testicularia cyperi]|uniref:Uncharacterized protein n=1 Tax=Testicularia cyperi TaxID=1882483 RepID=A0A317XKH8_9BASI|nr:hypothetical protein BCV70DRAFT_43373 [Testicularia cyperi]